MMPDWHHWAIQDGHQIQDDRQNKAFRHIGKTLEISLYLAMRPRLTKVCM